MTDLTSIGGTCWLQGRKLLPILKRDASSCHGVVLDLGCGRSPFKELFVSASQYVRIDRCPIDAQMIVSDIRTIPMRDASADCILLSQVLGDVSDLPALFKELKRVLTHDGKILVYESISYPQHDLPNDYWRVLPNGLAWVAAQANLRVKAVHHLGGYFTQIAMHANIFLLAPLRRIAFLRPLGWMARAITNVLCVTLDVLCPLPRYASDYYASLEKAV